MTFINTIEGIIEKKYFKLDAILQKYGESLIIVLGETNDLLYYRNNELSFYTKCATGINGFGNDIGSRKTPLGLHKISGFYGDKMDITTIFKGRKAIGNLEYYPESGNVYPAIITRILQLKGLEPINSNTEKRYIYIHGTPNIWYWETENLKKSYGCISLKPVDMIDLFEKIKYKKESYVYIIN